MQIGWLLTLVVPDGLFIPVFLLLVVAELAVPVIAERGSMTTFHPHHIAERYGLFTVIVLGESVTAATLAFQGALDEAEDGGTMIGMAVAGIVTLFCLWWIYFDHEAPPRLNTARASRSLGLRALLRLRVGRGGRRRAGGRGRLSSGD